MRLEHLLSGVLLVFLVAVFSVLVVFMYWYFNGVCFRVLQSFSSVG